MTNEEYAQILTDVQEKIAEIIRSVASAAKVYSRFVTDGDDAKWAALLRNADSKIHALSVSLAGRGSVEKRLIPIGCMQPILKFRIVGYYGYDFGTTTVNSEKKMRDELAAIDLTFEKLYDLDLANIVERHEGFLYDVKNSFLGANKMHIVPAGLQVQLNPISIR